VTFAGVTSAVDAGATLQCVDEESRIVRDRRCPRRVDQRLGLEKRVLLERLPRLIDVGNTDRTGQQREAQRFKDGANLFGLVGVRRGEDEFAHQGRGGASVASTRRCAA